MASSRLPSVRARNTLRSRPTISYNGDDPNNLDSFQQFGDLLPYQTSGAGWLSMVDNEANDVTNIFADYYGTSDPTNFQSYLAVDANFANAASDVLLIGGIEDTNNIYGSTGIVVNKLNTTTTAAVGDMIPVVTAYGNDHERHQRGRCRQCLLRSVVQAGRHLLHLVADAGCRSRSAAPTSFPTACICGA